MKRKMKKIEQKIGEEEEKGEEEGKKKLIRSFCTVTSSTASVEWIVKEKLPPLETRLKGGRKRNNKRRSSSKK